MQTAQTRHTHGKQHTTLSKSGQKTHRTHSTAHLRHMDDEGHRARTPNTKQYELYGKQNTARYDCQRSHGMQQTAHARYKNGALHACNRRTDLGTQTEHQIQLDTRGRGKTRRRQKRPPWVPHTNVPSQRCLARDHRSSETSHMGIRPAWPTST